MKNIRKLLGITAVGAVIALALVCTACEEQEYTWRFENRVSYKIVVSCSDLDPNLFEIDAYVQGTSNIPSVTATSKKNSITIGYSVPGRSSAWVKDNVSMEQNGTSVQFVIGPSPDANIRLAQE